jgi:hypothetical protein
MEGRAPENNNTVVAQRTALPRNVTIPFMGVAVASWVLDLGAYATGPAAVVDLVVSAAVTEIGGTGAEGAALALPLKVRFHLGEWGCKAWDTVPKMDLCV